ncbi:MAG: hypothetical protein WAO91_07310 [Candidatus Nitrosotenuis sp.]
MSKTPAQQWEESILKYRKSCQRILGISKTIRYAGVINKYGRTLTGVIRPGIRPILRQEDAKNEFFLISNLITLRSSQAKVLGGFEHATLVHKKATIVCIPANKVIYYVSINPNTNSIDDTIMKIKKII